MASKNLHPKSLWRALRSGTSSPDTTSTTLRPIMGKDILLSSVSDPLTIAVIGCGQRGKAYARYALEQPSKCKIVAMAEPRPKTRSHFAAAHNVDQTLVFDTWQDLHQASTDTIKTIGKRLSDAVIIAVQDQIHLEVCLAFAEQGYHILCEKPMSTNLEDCLKMEGAVKKAGIIFGMGHVLRYSPYNLALTEIIRSGELGPLINIVHVEPVGYYHFAHSYVRGHWRKEEESCFSLMTKSCHDIDIMCHWLSPYTPKRVSSFGSLQHFRKESKPSAASSTMRCLECPIERDCAYSAKKIYLEPVQQGNTNWPVSTIVDGIPDIENITDALKTSRYGQCVYECDNDVCDNQVVNLEFSNGTTASFTMIAHTRLICERQTRLHFAFGEIVGNMSTFTVTDFRKRTTVKHTPASEGGGHGGGDLGLTRTFVEAVKSMRQEVLGTDVGDALRSHLTVFAAERSRREGRVVDCEEFEREARERLQKNETAQT
ncbi:streptomycin biosynthesis protein StrI [Irpex rosettiformis]|uniref:Streptomycin biosynthesis protein StrI n=1 Tax=Irpex rosettiformis TaxID=378272 RepID=A0ACB8UEY2_9APHY|nr:streptomycin biosynthesis protein StrI [Irpex rosettiformis]